MRILSNGYRAFLYNFTGIKKPFVVSFVITEKCNMKCLYCGNSKIKKKELSTDEIIKIINDLHLSGINMISITGGEPLLRDDMGEIIRILKDKNFFIKLNTNGLLLKKRINVVNDVNVIQISLDGGKEIYKNVRGVDAYDDVIENIKYVAKLGKHIYLQCVISSHNVNKLDEIIDIARMYKLKVYFQPARLHRLKIKDKNPLFPDIRLYEKAIDKLIELKKDKDNVVLNSMAGLQYIKYLPTKPKAIKCYAGRLAFRIDVDGMLYNCDEFYESGNGVNLLEYNFSDAVKNIPAINCKKCWCANLVEFNLTAAFNFDSVWNTIASFL